VCCHDVISSTDRHTSLIDLHMVQTIFECNGVRVVACASEGEKIQSAQDGIELIGDAHFHGASLVLIPVERLEEGFFRLRTGLAGEIIQKFVTYRLRLAIVGDISRYVSDSTAFRDFVYESNQGDQVWFVANLQELEKKLAS
jgi:hypothetical protein